MKLYRVAIIATDSKQRTKVRFTDQIEKRLKKMKSKNFTDIHTFELHSQMTKVDALRELRDNANYPLTEEQKQLVKRTLSKHVVEHTSARDVLDAIRERNNITLQTDTTIVS